jgi:predicted RNA binding protein YcfA (HicA-like mRNA interferase family)
MSRFPSVKPRDVIASSKNWASSSIIKKGAHLYFWQPALRRMTCVPMHPEHIKPGTLRAIIKQAGLTPEEFHRLV